MKPEYAAYLDELIEAKRRNYVKSQQDILTRQELLRAECVGFTEKFVAKFPHLRRQAGFFKWSDNRLTEYQGTEHWWCVEPDGTIVDPTFEQFHPYSDQSEPVYTEFDPKTHRILIGKCMNCGWEIYGLEEEGPKSVCDPEEGEEESDCARELQRYYARI